MKKNCHFKDILPHYPHWIRQRMDNNTSAQLRARSNRQLKFYFFYILYEDKTEEEKYECYLCVTLSVATLQDARRARGSMFVLSVMHNLVRLTNYTTFLACLYKVVYTSAQLYKYCLRQQTLYICTVTPYYSKEISLF